MAKQKGGGTFNSRNTLIKSKSPTLPTPPPITCRVMSDAEALGLEAHYYPFFGPMLSFEQMVFRTMEKLCPEYSGGAWSYHCLSNGAWYMAPEHGTYALKDWVGERHPMSADGAGLAITQYVVNHLSWYFHEKQNQAATDAAIAHFHALRAYTAIHPDATAINLALD